MSTQFLVSVDTEEDQWGWRSSSTPSCTNARAIPGLVRFFERLGVRPTFFATYQMLRDPSSRDVIRDVGSEAWTEVGGHVHPWNTPPLDAAMRRESMLYRYPANQQRAKIAVVTRLIEDVVGRRPASFRAGRFGFGPSTATALLQEGYSVDSSVTPYWDWRGSSHGPSYLEASLGIRPIAQAPGAMDMGEGPRLIEVPVTGGFTGLPYRSWRRYARLLDTPAMRIAHLGGAASRLLGVTRAILSPETHEIGDLIDLSRRALQSGVGHLHLFFHSSSLIPGLTPFTATSSDVERLFDRIEGLLDALRHTYSLLPATVGEAGERYLLPQDGPPDTHDQTTPAVHVSPSLDSIRTGPASLRAYRGRAVHLAFWLHHLYWMVGGHRRYKKDVRWEEVRRIVFVCKGNICRSAYAEHSARKLGLAVASIGVDTMDGSPADEMAVKVARARGIDLTAHRTKSIEDFEAEPGDLLVGMEPWHLTAVGQQDHWRAPHQVTLLGLFVQGHGAVVLDPFGGDEGRFAHCLSLIDAGIRGIQEEMRSRLGDG